MTNTEKDEMIEGLWGLCFLLLLPFAFYGETWAGWLIWKWHVAPLFHLPQPTKWQLFGLLCLTSFIRARPSYEKRKASENAKAYIGMLASEALLFFLAWCAS